MKLARRLLVATAGFVGLTLVALLVCEARGWPFLRGPLQNAIAGTITVPVRLDGDFRMQLLRGPSIAVDRLHIGAGGGVSAPHLLEAGKIALAARWGDLWRWWRGEAALHIMSIEAGMLDARLVRVADGRASWQITKPREGRPDTPDPERDAMPHVGTLVVEQGFVQVADAPLDTFLRIVLQGREVAAVETVGRVDAAASSSPPPRDTTRSTAAAASAPAIGPGSGGYRATIEGRWRALPLALAVRTGGAMPLLLDEGSGNDRPSIALRVEGEAGAARVLRRARRGTGRCAPARGRHAPRGPVARRSRPAARADLAEDASVRSERPHRTRRRAVEPAEQQRRDRQEPPRRRPALRHAREAAAAHGPARRARAGAGRPRARGRRADRWQGRAEGPGARDGAGAPARRPRAAAAAFRPAVAARDGRRRADRGRAARFRQRRDRAAVRRARADRARRRRARPARIAGRRGRRARVRLEPARCERPARALGREAELRRRRHRRLAAGLNTAALGGGNAGREAKAAPSSNDPRALRRERRAAKSGGDQAARSLLTGVIDVGVDVTGAGRSTAEILSTLDGSARVLLRDGSVSHLVTEGLGLDIAQALGVVIRGDQSLPLNCARLDLAIDDGRVQIQRGVIDNEDSTIRVGGRLNLGEETLEVVARSRPKDFSILSLRSPITVTGSFGDPQIGVEGGRIAARLLGALTLGAVVGPVAALLPLMDPGSREEGEPCAAKSTQQGTPADSREAKR